MNDDGKLLTLDEVAEYLRLSPGTVRTHVTAGSMPYLKAGASLRFRRSEIDAWMESHREPEREEVA